MLDRHEGQGRAREPRVGGDQGGTQPLGEGEIRGIIGGAGRAMLPDPGEEWEMRMSLDGPVRSTGASPIGRSHHPLFTLH